MNKALEPDLFISHPYNEDTNSTDFIRLSGEFIYTYVCEVLRTVPAIISAQEMLGISTREVGIEEDWVNTYVC